MTAKVILNPYSNRWNAKKRWHSVEEQLKQAEVSYSLAVSEGPGDIERISYSSVLEGFSPIIAAGGDGTIGETVNGMMKARFESELPPLGVIPLGTANDLMYNLGQPLDLAKSVQAITSPKMLLLDVCMANDRYFINNSAVGLEPFVTTIQQKISYLKGIPRYLAAALFGIGKNPTWDAKISWDDGGSFEGPINLLTVGNGARTGGLFFMSPNADPSDGLLTAVIASRPSSFSILTLLPKTMSPKGSFIHSPGIQEISTTTLTIELDRPSPAHCDGELFPEEVLSVNYTILPQTLGILVV